MEKIVIFESLVMLVVYHDRQCDTKKHNKCFVIIMFIYHTADHQRTMVLSISLTLIPEYGDRITSGANFGPQVNDSIHQEIYFFNNNYYFVYFAMILYGGK